MKELETYDIAFTDKDKVISYLMWVRDIGFIPVNKEDYEKKFIIKK